MNMLNKDELESYKALVVDPFAQEKHVIIAGPCSIESAEMIDDLANQLSNMGIKYLRGGAWKPRTKPGGFSGHGEKAVQWISSAAKKHGMIPLIEVAEEHHIDSAMQNGIDHVWIGARTVSNPFSIAELVKHIPQHVTVLVKNPISADVDLWEGALLRLLVRGIRKIGIIHRGFTNSGGELRNSPCWGTLAEMMTRFPGIRVISDPSHMTGDSNLVEKYAKISKTVGTGGFMIETHCTPDKALTDAKQQITPMQLFKLVNALGDNTHEQPYANIDMKHVREIIDSIDRQIYDLLAERLSLSHSIAMHKISNNLPIVDPVRWKAVLEDLYAYESAHGKLSKDFVLSVFTRIHEESVTVQASHVK